MDAPAIVPSEWSGFASGSHSTGKTGDQAVPTVLTPGAAHLREVEKSAAFIGGANILSGMGRGDCVVTPIGRVPVDREAVGDVTIALRPEHLQIEAAGGEEPAGRVVSRVFHGHDLTIRVSFPNTELTVWDDYRCPFRVGDVVKLRPREKGVVVE